MRYTPPKKADKKAKNLLVKLRKIRKFDYLLDAEIHSNKIIFLMCSVLGPIRGDASYSSASQEQTGTRAPYASGWYKLNVFASNSSWFIAHLLLGRASLCRRGYKIKAFPTCLLT